VARLSQRCWKEAEKIFQLYSHGKIKGQKKAKDVELGLPDCKKSNWQFLHGLEEEQQFSLLQELSSSTIAFAEASAKAEALKTEEKVLNSSSY
jgi:hypothetical protein